MAAERAAPQPSSGPGEGIGVYPWSLEFQGAQYHGTVVVAERWAPELGRALEREDDHFRIVLLTQPQAVPQEGLEDPRVLCWVPTQTSYRLGSAGAPRRALRERAAPFGQTVLFGAEARAATPRLALDVRVPSRLLSRAPLSLDAQTLAAANAAEDGLRLLAIALLSATVAPGIPVALLPSVWALWGEARRQMAAHQSQELSGMLSLRLTEIDEGLQRIGEELPLLLARLGGELEPAHKAVLERLASLVPGTRAPEFALMVRERYSSVDELAQDVREYERIQRLCAVGAEVRQAKGYLDALQLPQEEEALEMERKALLIQLNFLHLLSQPHLWPGIAAHVQQFKGRYRSRYQAYHRAYQERLATLRARVEAWGPQLRALIRLNALLELGEPLAPELPQHQIDLLSRLVPCSAGPDGREPDPLPVCSVCGFSPLMVPPQEEVQQWTAAAETALREQLRRLSAETIHAVIASSNEPKLDQFLKVVQASDLSSLVTALDDEMITFLHRVIEEARTFRVALPILDRLKERFPWVEEGQEEAAAEAFAALLREALRKAKASNPHLQIRLDLQ